MRRPLRIKLLVYIVLLIIVILSLVGYVDWNSGGKIKRLTNQIILDEERFPLHAGVLRLGSNDERSFELLGLMGQDLHEVLGPESLRWNINEVIPWWLANKNATFKKSQNGNQIGILIEALPGQPFIPIEIDFNRKWSPEVNSLTWKDGRMDVGLYLIDSLLVSPLGDIPGTVRQLRILVSSAPASIYSLKTSLNLSTMACLALARRFKDGTMPNDISGELVKIRMSLRRSLDLAYATQLCDWVFALQNDWEQVSKGLKIPSDHSNFKGIGNGFLYKFNRFSFARQKVNEYSIVHKQVLVEGVLLEIPRFQSADIDENIINEMFGQGVDNKMIYLPWVQLLNVAEFSSYLDMYLEIILKLKGSASASENSELILEKLHLTRMGNNFVFSDFKHRGWIFPLRMAYGVIEKSR